jgi:transcription antitermination factor NusG
MNAWYIIRCRQELNVRDALAERGLFAYVPCETVERRLGRKLRVVHRAISPGYVFVCCHQSDLPEIREIDGVHDFIRSTFEGVRVPATMPAKQLQWLFLAELFGDMDYTRLPKPYAPSRGDRVMIRSGRWKGYIARIISVGKRKSSLAPEKGFGRWTVENEHLEAAA